MRNIICWVLLVWLVGCNAPAKTTSHLAPKDYPARVAVLPFQVILNKRPAVAVYFDDQQMEELTRYMSVALQGLLQEKLRIHAQERNRDNSFLSTQIINDKLASQQISFATLFASSRKELCQLLGVDAVISPQIILAEAPRESMAEVANPFWSVRMNINLFNNAVERPVWTFKADQRMTQADQKWNLGLGRARDYPSVLRSFEPPIQRLVKNFVKEYPFREK